VRNRFPLRRPSPFFFALAALAVLMAVGSYPVARPITRRLETLEGGVKRWGAGDLAHRVAVEGDDEAATVAATFNRAAGEVEALVAQQRQMVAGAGLLAGEALPLEQPHRQPGPPEQDAQGRAPRAGQAGPSAGGAVRESDGSNRARGGAETYGWWLSVSPDHRRLLSPPAGSRMSAGGRRRRRFTGPCSSTWPPSSSSGRIRRTAGACPGS
jgi:HAMP domain-containing protein